MEKTSNSTKCVQCKGKASRRGCCFNCYQRVRRAVIAKTITWDEAMKRRLVLAPGKRGPRSRYA